MLPNTWISPQIVDKKEKEPEKHIRPYKRTHGKSQKNGEDKHRADNQLPLKPEMGCHSGRSLPKCFAGSSHEYIYQQKKKSDKKNHEPNEKGQ